MRNNKLKFKILFKILLLISALFVFGLTVKAEAAEYYVDQNSPGPTHDGMTSITAFLTVQPCLTVAQPGDICSVLAGTYIDDINTVRNGNEVSSIVLSGAGNGQSIISGKITLRHSYHRLNGLKIRDKYLEMPNNGANHNVLENNEFTASTQGIYMKDDSGTNDGNGGPAFNVIRNNTFHNLTGNGMVVLSGHDNLVSSNTFRDGVGYDALRVWGYDQIISDNQFLRIIADQIATGGNHADVIQTFKSSNSYIGRGIIFERNLIKESTAQFGMLSGAVGADLQDWTFRNNLFIHSRIQLNNYLPRVKVYNNTIYNVPIENTVGFRFTSSAEDGSADYGEVYNNIFISNSGFYSISDTLVGTVADYNIISDMNGLARLAPNEGAHGIDGGFQPQDFFKNIAAEDFSLKAGSIAIGTGTNLGATGFSNDILGISRPQGTAWDIGAYEYEDSGERPSSPVGLSVR